MLEARAFVSEIETARKILEERNPLFKGEYICRDIIFASTNPDIRLEDKFLRLRINEKNIWNEKDVVVAIKETKKKEIGKESLIPLRKEFDTKEEAQNYIRENFINEFKESFEFTRTGWQYDLGEDQIDLEKVENLENCYTIEIKSKTEEGLKKLKEVFRLKDLIQGPTVVTIKELLRK